MTPLHDRITRAITPLEGWCTPEKAAVLCDLILARRPGLIVEIGVWGGRSLIAMGIAAQEAGTGMVFGIDPWGAGEALEGDNGEAHNQWWKKIDFERIYSGFVSAVEANDLLSWCRWVRASSEDSKKMFAQQSINFLHLDSNHSEFCSCRDVASWMPKLSLNAIFVIDDTDWPTQIKAIQAIRDSGFKEIHDGKTFLVFER